MTSFINSAESLEWFIFNMVWLLNLYAIGLYIGRNKSRDYYNLILAFNGLNEKPFLKKTTKKNIKGQLCAYQEVRNVSFSENVAYVLNE